MNFLKLRKSIVTPLLVGLASLAATTAQAYEIYIEFDPSGNGSIQKFNSGNSTGTPFSSGFGFPQGLVRDNSGNFYLVDQNVGQLLKVPAAGGSPTVLGNTGISPYDVAIDSGGNLYVANYVANTVQKFGPTGTNLGNFVTGIFTPDGLAFDAAGNLYVSSYGDGTVQKYNVSGTLVGTIGSGVGPQGLTFDSAGNLYVAYSGSGVVKKYNSSGAFVSNFASGLTQPTDLAFDPNGYLYVTDWGISGKVEIYSPTGVDLGPFLSNVPYVTGILIVPEPGTAALLLAGAAVSAARRRRR